MQPMNGPGPLLAGQHYQPRIVDRELDDLLTGLPAIAIQGPRAVGKTRTALERARTVRRLDDEAQRAVVGADPTLLLAGPTPILIDEWQRHVASWDTVRRAVDDDPSPGRFLLTGSATPAERPTHSGAGRIVTLRMRPLSLAERKIEEPTVRLATLLDGSHPVIEGTTGTTLEAYADEILGSGLPAVRRLPAGPRRAQIDGYLDRIVESDIEQVGRPVRNEPALRRWMAAYAAATATTTSFRRIHEAATTGRVVASRSVTIPYQDALERLWLIDAVPAWLPSRNHLRRLTAAPKHHLADPALAARLLGVDKGALLEGRDSGISVPRDGPLIGALFESLVTLSLRTYAQAAGARLHHLRTHRGEREVDLIVERDDHRVLAVEVKLAQTVSDHDVRHLNWLHEQIGDDLLDRMVITTGPEAYRRADGVAVVPAALLGP